jgi:hypothetical protein
LFLITGPNDGAAPIHRHWTTLYWIFSPRRLDKGGRKMTFSFVKQCLGVWLRDKIIQEDIDE